MRIPGAAFVAVVVAVRGLIVPASVEAQAEDSPPVLEGAVESGPGDSLEDPEDVERVPVTEEVKDHPADLDLLDVKHGGARLVWEWQRFGWEHAVFTGAAGAVLLATALIPPTGEWVEPLGVDEDVRDTVRLGDPQHRLWAQDASDVLLSFSTSYPLIIDAAIVSAYYRSSPDVAIQIALISMETMIVNAAVTGAVKMLTGRRRPYVRNCGDELDIRFDDCQRDDRNRSFLSGHASQTFASAALTCTHHLHLPIYGGGTADDLACPVAFIFAGAAGTLRIASDRHYFVDVLAGAGTGTLVGFLVPWLLHYSRRSESGSDPETAEASVRLVPTGSGAAVVGVF